MIDLSDKNKYMIEVKSSKGNQPKWKIADCYYKQDYLGYEGLVEYVVSELLKKSNLKENEFVLYQTDVIQNGRYIRNGCVSNNFLGDNESLITLNRIYRQFRNQRQLSSDVISIKETKDRVLFIDNLIKDTTGINNFGKYFCKMIEIDSFFLNEDRHFNNIALIYKNSKYELCPIFDNGSALLSDTMLEYQMGNDIYKLIDMAKPKTFVYDFYEQLEAVESIYGQQIEFYFDKNDVEEIINNETNYQSEEKNRIKDIIFEQMRKYDYLFK